jgi:hypothetical protein
LLRNLREVVTDDPIVFRFSDDARVRFREWRLAHLRGARERYPDDLPPHLAKGTGAALREWP